MSAGELNSVVCMSKKTKNNRREFLLGFFKQEVDKNETVELNGFILFKHWDGNVKRWTVDIFSKESYQNMIERRFKPIQETTLF